jgi:hypothetical protein
VDWGSRRDGELLRREVSYLGVGEHGGGDDLVRTESLPRVDK